MFSNVHKCVLGAIAAVGLTFGSVPAEATTVLLSHNGSLFPMSMPGGTGVVPVNMTCMPSSPNGFIEHSEDCTKDWTAFPSQPHVIEWGDSQGTLFEDIINTTGIPWTDYHWEVIGRGNTGKAVDVEIDATVDWTIGSMPIADGVAFWLFFNEPFTPTSEGEFQVRIDFSFDFMNGGIVEIHQYPTIPEPATLALMGLGLAGIGYRRRRSKKAA